jgi:hypothetical protein
MASVEKQIIIRVLEHYIRTGSASDDQVNVSCLPVDTTCHVEQIGEDSRIVLLDEYRLDGKVIWASYSTRSETVFMSLKSA